MKKSIPDFIVNWRITEMESWSADYFDMQVPAYITVRNDLSGKFQFGLVQSQFDGKIEAVETSYQVVFSWSDFDENDTVNGHGWLEAIDDLAEGRILIYLGDESGFKAEPLE